MTEDHRAQAEQLARDVWDSIQECQEPLTAHQRSRFYEFLNAVLQYELAMIDMERANRHRAEWERESLRLENEEAP